MNYRRYEVASAWEVEAESRHPTRDGETVTVTTLVADLRDKRNGAVYTRGAYRVQAPGHPTKTWGGETAWSHAENYADAIATTVWFGR